MRIASRSSIAVLAALLLAGCGSSSTSAGGGSGKSVILVTPSPVGSDHFLQLAVAGGQKAAKELGAKFKLYESNDPTSIAQNVDAAVRAKPSVLVGVSFSFDDVFTKVAPQHPSQRFLEVDSCPKKQAANVTCVAFKEQEAAYLAGIEAGALTKKKKLGVVAALDSPFIHRWIDPFFAGAKSVDPAVTGTPLYVGGSNPFSDPARAKAQAQSLAGGGADIIEAAASGGNQGVFQAAAAKGFTAFGVDTNECPASPGHVVDNVLKHVDVAEYNAIKDVVGGKTGGAKVYGLAEGGVGVTALDPGLASSQCLIANYPAVVAKVKQASADIVSGKTKVADPLSS
jgi:basic membrane protein A and related proteins